MAKNDPIADPIQLWREWVDQTERQWNSVLNEIMGTDQFGQASGRMMEVFLAMQASMNEATQRYFSALNLPTRSDLQEISDRLSGVEAMLHELSERLEAQQAPSAPPAARPRPKRTKKAPRKKAESGE